METNEIAQVVSQAVAMSNDEAAMWQAVISGIFGLLVTALTFWTKYLIDRVNERSKLTQDTAQQTAKSTEAIHIAVNSEHDRMVAESKEFAAKISELEKAISKLLVERAKRKGPDSEATLAELQSNAPLETAEK